MAIELLILAAVHVAAVCAAPHTAEASVHVPTVVIRSNFHAQDENGQYAYGYSSEDGQYKKEVKTLDGTVRGMYGYNSPDGKHVLVRYRADDGGFVAESDVLEQPGPVTITRPVISVTQQETVPDSRERDEPAPNLQPELEEAESGVQVDQDAYSNPGYSSYQQDTIYVADDGYEVSQYQPAASYAAPSSSAHKYYSSHVPVETSTTQSVDTGGLSDYGGYTSKSSGYSYTGSPSYSYTGSPSYSYTSSPSYYSVVPESSTGSTSASKKYYSSQTPVVYAVHNPEDSGFSNYRGYGKHPGYSEYARTPNNRLSYDSLYYPSRTSVVYVPPPEPKVYYPPKEDTYVYSTVKPTYEVRPVPSNDDYKPKTRLAVSVSHHGSPDIAFAPAPLVSVTPAPLLYSSSPVVKVHVGSPSTYHVSPAPAVKTVSLSPIQVKVNKPAVQSSYVVSSTPQSSYLVSSTPTPIKVVSPLVYKTKPVSVANPFKVHYVSSAPVKVKTPSLQAHSYYYTIPSSSYNTVSSYASAGTSYPYNIFPYAPYSYLPSSSFYKSYQPAYYVIQSPMAAVQSNLPQTYIPTVAASSYKYTNPVKVDVKPFVRPLTRHHKY